MQPLFTYGSGDTVYFLNNNRFQPYYYFGAHVGDTLLVPNTGYLDSVVNILVDSTGTIQVNNTSLRYYVYHVLAFCSIETFPQEKVVERLGMITNKMLPHWACVTDDYYYSFCSYQDDSIFKSDSPIACDYVYTYNDIKGVGDAVVSIQPNPAINVCSLHLNGVYKSMPELFDVTGKKIPMLFTQSGYSVYNFDVKDIASGLYFVLAKNAEGIIGQAKFIKQ